MRIVRAVTVLAAVAAGSTACQHSKIVEVKRHHELGSSDTVVVRTFDMSKARWTGDQGPHTQEAVRTHFACCLVSELAQRDFHATQSDAPQSPAGAIVVRGRIELVDAGSGALRTVVGCGAGQSRFTGVAEVYTEAAGDARPAYVLRFEGGSHAVGGPGYPSFVDACDAAREIADFIATHRTARP